MHTSSRYNRSAVMNFFELPELAQATLNADCTDTEDFERIESDSYVEFKYDNRTEYLSLSNFVRFNSVWMPEKNPIWDACAGTSAYSGYFIKLSDCGSEAVVVERYY